jgi:plastocyanin
MTYPWRICFSLLVACPVWGASVLGSVSLADSRDPAARQGHDRSGVVVWLESVNAGSERFPSRTARMEQKGKQFIPHVVAIPVGSNVNFPNDDPIFHNAFSNFSGQMFDLGLYPPGSSRTITFTRPGIVRVFCNIHPTMSAVVAVLNSAWFAVTGPAGEFSIPDVPAGEYRLRLYHERASETTLRALERRVVVSRENLILPPIAIPETGYVEGPHKNKYGHDYPPGGAEGGTYPAKHP